MTRILLATALCVIATSALCQAGNVRVIGANGICAPLDPLMLSPMPTLDWAYDSPRAKAMTTFSIGEAYPRFDKPACYDLNSGLEFNCSIFSDRAKKTIAGK